MGNPCVNLSGDKCAEFPTATTVDCPHGGAGKNRGATCPSKGIEFKMGNEGKPKNYSQVTKIPKPIPTDEVSIRILNTIDKLIDLLGKSK